MRVSKELNLTSFEFWSGATSHKFSYNELKELEHQLEDLFHEQAPTETDINDMFWFEEEMLCEWLGIDFEKNYLER
tara:strand:- start:49 stop:276 length:228 start_codon:yes stop_codon:yes gene_type:complete